MTGGSDDERGPALTLEGEESVVDPPRCQHQPVHLHDLLIGQAQFTVMEVPVEIHAVSAMAGQLRSSPLRRKRRRSPISRIRSSASKTAAWFGLTCCSLDARRMALVAPKMESTRCIARIFE